MKGRTRDEDTYQTLKSRCTESNERLQKLASLTTDWAPAMLGCKTHHLSLHHLLRSFRCEKFLILDVMNVVSEINKSIQAEALPHRLLTLLNDEADYENLIQHNEVRWLSKGKVLARFL